MLYARKLLLYFHEVGNNKSQKTESQLFGFIQGFTSLYGRISIEITLRLRLLQTVFTHFFN